MIRRPPTSTLFPHPTLSRSRRGGGGRQLPPLGKEQRRVNRPRDPARRAEMLAQRLHRLVGALPIPRDLHGPGAGARPALEPDRADRAGAELYAQTRHYWPPTGLVPGETTAMSLSLQRFGLDMRQAPAPAR